MAPPHSFISVKDFATPKDLVDYIKYLDGNNEAYVSYFWWKSHYEVVIGSSYQTYNYAPETLTVCEMCRRLHDPNEPPSQVAGFEELAKCRQVPPNYWSTT